MFGARYPFVFVCEHLLTSLFGHNQINAKAAESLADPEEYPNLFTQDWEWALKAEESTRDSR